MSESIDNSFIHVICNSCGKKYKVRNPDKPKKYKCKFCNTIVIIKPQETLGSKYKKLQKEWQLHKDENLALFKKELHRKNGSNRALQEIQEHNDTELHQTRSQENKRSTMKRRRVCCATCG